MKKMDIVNLIRCHVENDDAAFRRQARQIARDFDSEGDTRLAEYLSGLLSGDEGFVPQSEVSPDSDFFRKVEPDKELYLLPDVITKDLLGIVHAMERNISIHRFLFQGKPGTGKTEAAKQLAKLTGRTLFLVDFTTVIDSRLGQTQKNLTSLFTQMNRYYAKTKAIFLFDEIDAIALDRIDEHDLREMGRATSTILRELDGLDPQVMLIATTNLYDRLDKALQRRFDAVISFDRYTQQDLMEIAEQMLDQYLDRLHLSNHDIRLFRKIMQQKTPLPYPGDLKNMIRTAVAFSDPHDDYDYFRRLYTALLGKEPSDPEELREQGFTVREIALLTGSSKSTIDRKLKE
jgi:SpoVK/Ycf46/Vps4 family AAA+-type ATPase